MFKVTLFDDAIKVGVIVAVAVLFATVLRRMIEPAPLALRQTAHQPA
jgi:hypothetical protein